VAGRRLRWRHGDPAHRCRERSETEGFRSKGATRNRSQLLWMEPALAVVNK
jgi:hypothetical protein